jgi:hypothetical protein
MEINPPALCCQTRCHVDRLSQHYSQLKTIAGCKRNEIQNLVAQALHLENIRAKYQAASLQHVNYALNMCIEKRLGHFASELST